MLTTSELRNQLEHLVRKLEDPDGDGKDAERALGSWTARELLMADELFRRHWMGYPAGRVSVLVRSAFKDIREAVWLTSMSRDGHLREYAVARLRSDPTSIADRLLAVRLDDPVDVVRVPAWDAIGLRCNETQAAVVGPILVAMRGRRRSGEALDRYAILFNTATGSQLASALRTSDDRAARRWAMGCLLDAGAVPPMQAVDALAAEPDQVVATQLASFVAGSGDMSAVERLLDSKHASAREEALTVLPDGLLSDAKVHQALMDRACRVRAAAREVATRRGIDTLAYCDGRWLETHDPRALQGVQESGGVLDRERLMELLRDPNARIRNLAIEMLGRNNLDEAEIQALIGLLDDPRSATPATRVLARSFNWRYELLAPQWRASEVVKQRRLWRLLSSRGGWDRVRASLLAATHGDPSVAGLGRADLAGWRQGAASRMWRPPTDNQLDDLARYLPQAAIPRGLRADIEFRAGLPVTPPPRPEWTTDDALIVVALTGTGGLFRRSRSLRQLLYEVDAQDHGIPTAAQLMTSVGRLVGSGIMEPPAGDSYRLTPMGRALLKQMIGPRSGHAKETLALLRGVPLVEHLWWLRLDEYDHALPFSR